MYIIGTSTLAEIIVEILLSQGKPVIGFFDDFNKEPQFLNIPILGNIDFLLTNKSSFMDTKLFIAIGDNDARQSIQAKLKDEGFKFGNVVHTNACIEKSASMGEGNYIGSFAYLGTGTSIGDGNLIFKGVSLTHHNKVGNFTFFSPNVSVGGFTVIGNLVKLGMNSVVKPYINVGESESFEPLSLVEKK